MADSRSHRTDRPNVIFIHPHNLGKYLGNYGRPVDTPNVDSIARDGVSFSNYFCTAPACSPARGSLWTGRYPHNNGLVGLAHLGWKLNEDEVTLVDHLNDAGYSTHLFGVQHVSSDPSRLGFQHLDGSVHDFTVDEPARDVADRVESFLARAASEREQPFFASVGFSEVHRQPLVERCLDCGWTFDLPGYESDDPEAVEPLPYLPDRQGIREDLAHFHGMVRAIDEAVGRILTAVERAGIREETLIVFSTDHGIGFPRAMGTCYDPGVETALHMHWPGEIEGGQEIDELLSQVDFLPTMLELVGEESPDGSHIDGRSFAPLVTDESEREQATAKDESERDRRESISEDESYEPRDQIYHEFTWHSKYVPMRAIRTSRYKYIRNFGDQPQVYIPAPLFSSNAGRAVRDEFYAEQRPQEELYDLQADPLEQNNLAADPEYAEALCELRAQIDSWMDETDDPLLDGEWPPTPEQEERIKKSPWIPK